MKKLLFAIICIGFVSCTQNQMARNFGGTEVINLEPGKRLVNITWKGNDNASLWILTKQDTTAPSTYSFKEKSGFGNMEGEVIINEK